MVLISGVFASGTVKALNKRLGSKVGEGFFSMSFQVLLSRRDGLGSFQSSYLRRFLLHRNFILDTVKIDFYKKYFISSFIS